MIDARDLTVCLSPTIAAVFGRARQQFVVCYVPSMKSSNGWVRISTSIEV